MGKGAQDVPRPKEDDLFRTFSDVASPREMEKRYPVPKRWSSSPPLTDTLLPRGTRDILGIYWVDFHEKCPIQQSEYMGW